MFNTKDDFEAKETKRPHSETEPAKRQKIDKTAEQTDEINKLIDDAYDTHPYGLKILTNLIINPDVDCFRMHRGWYGLHTGYNKIQGIRIPKSQRIPPLFINVKALLKDEKTKLLTEELILKKIRANTTIRDNFCFPYNKPQSLAWFYEQKIQQEETIRLDGRDLRRFTEDKWETFCRGIQISGVTKLIFYYNCINTSKGINDFFRYQEGKAHARKLGEALKKSNIKTLRLNSEEISFSAWKVFFRVLEDADLEELDFGCSHFNCLSPYDDEEEMDKSIFKPLFHYLSKMRRLNSLDLGLCDMNHLNARQWEKFFKIINRLGVRRLDITSPIGDICSPDALHNATPKDSWDAIFKGLSESSITQLTLDDGMYVYEGIKLSDQKQERLKTILANNKKKIGLGQNGLATLCRFTLWNQIDPKVEHKKAEDGSFRFTYRSEKQKETEFNENIYNQLVHKNNTGLKLDYP